MNTLPHPPRERGDISRRHLLGATLGAVGTSLWSGPAAAQGWPTRPIRIVAAQAPGSSNDATARALAEYLGARLGGSVVVENRPGGIGMIAADHVARAAPDGHTLLFTLHSQLAQAPVLLKKVPLDPARDLVPIAAFGTGVAPMVVKKDLPVRNLRELIALARQKPVSVGNFSIGSAWQLMMKQLQKQTGAQFDIVTYKGTGPMIMDLLAGNIDVGAGSLAGLTPGIQRGALRPILVITGERAETLLPGVPTWADEGITGKAFGSLRESNMLLGPVGLDSGIVARLAALARESAAQSENMKRVLTQLGVNRPPWVGADLKAFIQDAWPAYQSMTREQGLTAE